MRVEPLRLAERDDEAILTAMADAASVAVRAGVTTVRDLGAKGDLIFRLRERIDSIFLPRPIVLLDALPRNSTGKLPRATLAALAQEHRRKGAVHAQ